LLELFENVTGICFFPNTVDALKK